MKRKTVSGLNPFKNSLQKKMCTKVELEILLLICYYGFSEIKEGAQLFLLKLLQSFCMFCYYFVVNDITNHKMFPPPLSAKCMQCNLKSMQFSLCTFQRSLHLCRLHYYAPLPLQLVETHLENAPPPDIASVIELVTFSGSCSSCIELSTYCQSEMDSQRAFKFLYNGNLYSEEGDCFLKPC